MFHRTIPTCSKNVRVIPIERCGIKCDETCSQWTRDLPPKKTGRSARANHATEAAISMYHQGTVLCSLGRLNARQPRMLENPPALLLMLQKSHSQPPGMVLKPAVNNGINYLLVTCTNWFAGFLNHQKYEVHFSRLQIIIQRKAFFLLKPATFIKCFLQLWPFFSPSSLPSTTWLRATTCRSYCRLSSWNKASGTNVPWLKTLGTVAESRRISYFRRGKGYLQNSWGKYLIMFFKIQKKKVKIVY